MMGCCRNLLAGPGIAEFSAGVVVTIVLGCMLLAGVVAASRSAQAGQDVEAGIAVGHQTLHPLNRADGGDGVRADAPVDALRVEA